ncbi:MAG: hypothetical protein EBR82_46280 [Caulobacteraceae bacterium]|nr:hypothetical protein [Caulobacteraceae bacterium]
MNKIILRITLTSGEVVEIETKASDIINWESYFDIAIDKLEKFTHLLYLAWVAVKRSGKTTAEFEVWADLVKTVEVDDPKA